VACIYTTYSSEKRNYHYRLGGRHGKDRDERERDGETSWCERLYGVPIDKTAGISDIEDWETNRHSRRAVHGLDCEARKE